MDTEKSIITQNMSKPITEEIKPLENEKSVEELLNTCKDKISKIKKQREDDQIARLELVRLGNLKLMKHYQTIFLTGVERMPKRGWHAIKELTDVEFISFKEACSPMAEELGIKIKHSEKICKCNCHRGCECEEEYHCICDYDEPQNCCECDCFNEKEPKKFVFITLK
jgi:hypothetical protein